MLLPVIDRTFSVENLINSIVQNVEGSEAMLTSSQVYCLSL